MILTKFKNIEEILTTKEEYRGKEIDQKDLALFDKGFLPVNFNVGRYDVLEFILYDSSNNILTQDGIGDVRYIRGENISNYLINSENVDDKTSRGGGFLIDIQKLIKEAGYNTGLYKVQVNFVNDRVGSSVPKNKVWIHEISPSRRELRLLPFNNFDENSKSEMLQKRRLNLMYDNFVKNKFSGDEVYAEISMILGNLNSIELFKVFSSMYSQEFIDRLMYEFGLTDDLEKFFTLVVGDMQLAIKHELLHKYSIIGSPNFGKPLSDEVDYKYYNKQDIINLFVSKFRESVAYHLPFRALTDNIELDRKTLDSIDELKQLIQRMESDDTFNLPSISYETVEPITTEEIENSFVIKTTKVETEAGDVIIEVPVLKDTAIEKTLQDEILESPVIKVPDVVQEEITLAESRGEDSTNNSTLSEERRISQRIFGGGQTEGTGEERFSQNT